MIDHYKILHKKQWLRYNTGIIFGMRPANGGRRYNVTSSLIGWVHTQNDPNNTVHFKKKQEHVGDV